MNPDPNLFQIGKFAKFKRFEALRPFNPSYDPFNPPKCPGTAVLSTYLVLGRKTQSQTHERDGEY